MLNLIKALQGISAPNAANAESDEKEAPPPADAAPEQNVNEYNAMASILERHEAISNRVRQNKKR